MWSYEQERENSFYNESLTQGENMSASCGEYTHNAGAEKTNTEWILTPFDTWVRNPHYTGKPGPHPEDL